MQLVESKISNKQENNMHSDLLPKKYELFAHIFTMLFIRLFGKIETISSVCSGVTGYYSRQCSAVTR